MYTIDASVFVNAVEPRELDHDVSRRLPGLLRERGISIVVPNLVTVEVAGTVSRLRGVERARRLISILVRLRTVEFVALDEALAARAADFAAVHRLRGADAVYAAVAHHYETTLVSRDNEHLTQLQGIVPVLHPGAALASLLPPPAQQ